LDFDLEEDVYSSPKMLVVNDVPCLKQFVILSFEEILLLVVDQTIHSVVLLRFTGKASSRHFNRSIQIVVPTGLSVVHVDG
jgi:GTP:adenosylcobinamide-phosphate guanylyltransferase